MKDLSIKSSTARGRISHMIAIAKLIENDYQIYTEVGLNKWDLIAEKNDILYKVEIKTSPKLKEFPQFWKNQPDLLVLIDLQGAIKIIARKAH